MRDRIVLSGIAFLTFLLAACATAPKFSGIDAAPQVKVVITTDPAVKNYVDTAKLTEMTNAAMAKYAPAASPATVAVRFISLGAAYDVNSQIDLRSYPDEMPQYGALAVVVQEVPSTGEQRAVYAAGSTRATPLTALGSHQVVRGTYTITDAAGVVLERNEIFVRANVGEGITANPNDQRWFATYLAKRVAKRARGNS